MENEELTVTSKDALVLAKSYSNLNAIIAFCKRRWSELHGGSICQYPYPKPQECEINGLEWADEEPATVLYFLNRFFNEWEENQKKIRAEKEARLAEKQ